VCALVHSRQVEATAGSADPTSAESSAEMGSAAAESSGREAVDNARALLGQRLRVHPALLVERD